jgi:hypothetical protein
MSFFKNGGQGGQMGLIWGLVPVVGENIRKRCRRINMAEILHIHAQK